MQYRVRGAGLRRLVLTASLPPGIFSQGRKGLSEGVAYGVEAPALSRSQPAYGDGRISYEEPTKAKGHLDLGTEIALASAIVVPVTAAYAAAAYGIYRAVSALI